jgi:hypothetical protein
MGQIQNLMQSMGQRPLILNQGVSLFSNPLVQRLGPKYATIDGKQVIIDN